ncbi:MAG: S8 family peptidase [Bacteriovoracaceae bacterium]
MKTYLLLSTLLYVSPTYSQTETIKYLKKFKLSKLWAQKLVGADLVLEEIKKRQELPKINVGVIDGGFYFDSIPTDDIALEKEFNERSNRYYFRHHGTAVSNIISKYEENPYGVSPNARFTTLYTLTTNDNNANVVDSIINLPEEKRPKVINYSMSTNEVGYDAVGRFGDHGVIFVASAGNKFPLLPVVKDLARQKNILRVGSTNAFGLPSFFSSEGDSVDITAPSNREIQSLVQGESVYFGGTSGAAPVITGSITTLLGVLPGLELKDIKKLLTDSALELLRSATSQFKNPPALNYYRAYRTALNIKAKCLLKELSCFQREIQNNSNYQFPLDTSWEQIEDETEKEIAARKEFLLTQNKKAAQFLEELYRKKDLIPESLYYKTLRQLPDNEAQVRIDLEKFYLDNKETIVKGRKKEFNYVISHISKNFREYYKKQFKVGAMDDKTQSLYMLSRYRDQDTQDYFWSLFLSDDLYPADKQSILEGVAQNSPALFMKYYDKAMEIGNSGTRYVADKLKREFEY